MSAHSLCVHRSASYIIDGSWMPRYLATRDCATAASSSENRWAISASVFDSSMARLNSSMAFSKHPLQQAHTVVQDTLRLKKQVKSTVLSLISWQDRVLNILYSFNFSLFYINYILFIPFLFFYIIYSYMHSSMTCRRHSTKFVEKCVLF